jgi:hypothetical protein
MEGALDHRSSAKDSRTISDDTGGLDERESPQTRPTERPSAPRIPDVSWTSDAEPVRIDELRADRFGALPSGTYPSIREPRDGPSHERATPKVPAFDHELFEGAVPEVPRIPRMTPPPRSGIVASVATRLARTADAPLRAVREEVWVTRRDPRAEEDD